MNEKELQVFDSSYFRRRSHCVYSDGTQNICIFQPIFKYFKSIGNTNYVLGWKSKGLSDKVIKSPTITNNILL